MKVFGKIKVLFVLSEPMLTAVTIECSASVKYNVSLSKIFFSFYNLPPLQSFFVEILLAAGPIFRHRFVQFALIVSSEW